MNEPNSGGDVRDLQRPAPSRPDTSLRTAIIAFAIVEAIAMIPLIVYLATK
jgi:hypothetical protein